jgi:hypothetical protein
MVKQPTGRRCSVWCQENNISLNVNKTKELIMDFRKKQREHAPIHGGTVVEKLKNFKFLCLHFTVDLKWSTQEGIINSLQPQEAAEIRLGT